MSSETASIEASTEEPIETGAGVSGPAEQADPAAGADRPRASITEFVDGWHAIILRANMLLRDPEPAQFIAAAERADAEIAALIRDESEASLLLLVHAICTDLQRYSVIHSLMVAVVCDLAARTLDSCSDEHRRSLRRAALTMNIGMTRLQDQLALQATAVTPEQRALIDGHAARGVELLQEMGVTDELWLEAVAHHHDAPSGKLAAQSIEMQLARLIQRADVFTARMSPRKVRPALSAALAAKGAYFDEHEKPDEAGSLVIKAMGIYPAGSFVQLVSGELAVVLRRGRTANKPFLAGIADRHGIPYVQPVARATDDPSSAIVRGVPPNDVRVRIPVERLLKLAR